MFGFRNGDIELPLTCMIWYGQWRKPNRKMGVSFSVLPMNRLYGAGICARRRIIMLSDIRCTLRRVRIDFHVPAVCDQILEP